MKIYEFNDTKELHGNRLKYWSNACGELHHHGEYDIKNINDLPNELQRAYFELWEEGNGCSEYLVEFDKKYYIALITEFDEYCANIYNMSMEALYSKLKNISKKLHDTKLFEDTILILGNKTGEYNNAHEVIFLVSTKESKNVYDEIEELIYLTFTK